MKLSFSTKGWHGKSFDEFCDIAKDLRFSGIELHNVKNELFTGSDSAFCDYLSSATLRKLYEKKLSIPYIDSICDFSDEEQKDFAREEIEECIRIADNLHIPYIRLHANKKDESSLNYVESFLSELLPKAERAGVTLLLETSGLFCDSKTLREMLDRFAEACEEFGSVDKKATLEGRQLTMFIAPNKGQSK